MTLFRAMRSIAPFLVVLLATSTAAQQPSGEIGPERIAFHRVTVIPMTGHGALAERTVLVDHGRILAVGLADEVEIPAGFVVVDGRGRYLIPGLVDAHTHTFVPTDFKLYLAHGVTTVLEMSGCPDILRYRAQLAAGDRVGPRLFSTSPQLKVGPDPRVDREVRATSPDEARRAVRAFARAGYDFVKVWGPVSDEVHRAVCASARELGIRVTGHIPRDVGLARTLENGQQSVAHVEEYWNKFFRRRADASLLEDAVATSSAAGVTVVTTLITYENIADLVADGDPAGLLERRELRYIDLARRKAWGPELNDYRRRFGPRARDRLREALEFEQRIALALQRGGVRLVAGTDAGGTNLSLIPGRSLHRELELLVEAGLTPQQALAAATDNAGRFLGGAEPFGTIAVGQRADLVLLDRDPLEDIRNTRAIRGVVAAGRWFDRARLDALLESVAATMRATNALADLLFERGAAAAAAAYEKGGRAARFEPDALVLVAYLLAETGRVEDAMGALNLALRAAPGSYQPHFLLAAAFAGAGQVERAVEHYEAVLERVPDHVQAADALARIRGR